MSEPPEAPLGVLVTHGELGAELLRTCEAILGPQDRVAVLSNARQSLEGISGEIRTILDRHPGSAVFLFADLAGGSCGHACREIRALRPGTILFTGVNLPMLLEFLYNRRRVSLEELKERLYVKGREGIQCIG